METSAGGMPIVLDLKFRGFANSLNYIPDSRQISTIDVIYKQ